MDYDSIVMGFVVVYDDSGGVTREKDYCRLAKSIHGPFTSYNEAHKWILARKRSVPWDFVPYHGLDLPEED